MNDKIKTIYIFLLKDLSKLNKPTTFSASVFKFISEHERGEIK